MRCCKLLVSDKRGCQRRRLLWHLAQNDARHHAQHQARCQAQHQAWHHARCQTQRHAWHHASCSKSCSTLLYFIPCNHVHIIYHVKNNKEFIYLSICLSVYLDMQMFESLVMYDWLTFLFIPYRGQTTSIYSSLYKVIPWWSVIKVQRNSVPPPLNILCLCSTTSNSTL